MSTYLQVVDIPQVGAAVNQLPGVRGVRSPTFRLNVSTLCGGYVVTKAAQVKLRSGRMEAPA